MQSGKQPNSTELMYTVLAHLVVEKEIAGALNLLKTSEPTTADAALVKLAANLTSSSTSTSTSTSTVTDSTPSKGEKTGIASHLETLKPLLSSLLQVFNASSDTKEKLRLALQ
jgi:hypothetical protein